MAGDLYWNNVVLLLHCNGTDGSTTFTDSSKNGLTVTVSGDAHVETSDKKWGTASAEFDGTTDSLSLAASSAFNPSSTWTAELWVKADSLTSQPYLIGGYADSTHRWALQILNTGVLSFFVANGTGDSVATSATLSTGQWYFIEINNSGTTVTIRVDGASVYSGTPPRALYNANHTLEIGAAVFNTNSNSLDGFIDDVRFTQGVARNNTSAPSEEFPNGYQLVASDSTEAHQSAGVILKNIYCPPVAQVNQSPGVAITQTLDLAAGSDSQANQSTDGNVGIVSSITISIDTRDWGTSGIGIVINPCRSGTSSIGIGIGPYAGTSTITITINPRRSGTTSIPIGIYGDLTAEAGAQAVTWKPKCVLDGTDISLKLVGAIEIEAEEMSAPVASFSFLPASGTVDPLAWVGKTVVLSWQRIIAGSVSGERVRFTGIVSDPVWDADQRLIAISATGDLQSILDGMDKTSIASMIPSGTWSDTVLGDPIDQTGWEYAEALLSTCDDVIWQDASGAIRVSSCVPKVSADFTFEDSGRFEGSLQLDYASRMDFVTRGTITLEHRFKRRRERHCTFRWMPVELETLCHWLTGGYELPQRSMIESAAGGGGWTVLGDINYRPVIASGSARCLLGNPVTGESNYGNIAWVNNPAVTDAFAMGATWTAARRWMQTVTETITLTVNASESQATIGILPIEESYTVESEADDPTWESSLDYTGYVGTAVVMSNGVDRRDDLDVESRVILDAAQEVALAKARAEIRKSHRGTTVTFSTVYQPMLDLSHTVEVDCAALDCQGKVRRIRDRWDIDTGDCTTEISVALFRHNGSGLTSDDTLAAAAKPADPTETTPVTRVSLGFHIGGETSAPTYSEDWDGYITNYPDLGDRFDRMRTNPLVMAKVYEESFTVIPPEIDDEYTDPEDVTAAEVFEVTIPQDTLVLTSY